MTDTIPAPQPATSTSPSPALAFTLDRVRMNPDISFLEVRDAAKLADLVIYPIVFAKARSMLGLGPAVQRRRRVPRESYLDQPLAQAAAIPAESTPSVPDQTSPVPSVEPAAVWTPPPAEPAPVIGPAAPATKRPGNPGRNARPAPSQTLDGLVAYVRSIEEERDRLRAILEKVGRVVQDVIRDTGGL